MSPDNNNKKHLKDFIMDVKDMTNELGISEATQCAWRLRKENPLPYVRSGKGGKIFYIREQVLEWFKNNVK